MCLWNDRALARFCRMSDRNERAYRKAAELVNDALELSRPPVIWVKLDREGKKIVRLDEPHGRRVRQDILRQNGHKTA